VTFQSAALPVEAFEHGDALALQMPQVKVGAKKRE
jgi:hypothetical protein